MPADTDARALLESLVGQQIRTITGRPTSVLGIEGDGVIVATGRSPAGQPVPIEWVQNGIQRLLEEGELEVSVPSLGHRSAFVGTVLLMLPGAAPVQTTPPRVRLTDPASAYRLSEAGQVNAWWAGDPRQRFWLEITDRPDIGVDLHCPQRDAAGNRNTGYSLIWWVEPGDVVFHYSLNERAIVAWSRASGGVTEAPTVWLSHRGETRRRLQVARAQPGWWLDLDGPFPLAEPLTLAQLRERADVVRAILEQLRSAHAGSLYFPFFFWGGSDAAVPEQAAGGARRRLPATRRSSSRVGATTGAAPAGRSSGTGARRRVPRGRGLRGLGHAQVVAVLVPERAPRDPAWRDLCQ
jgi:hypothetical protein